MKGKFWVPWQSPFTRKPPEPKPVEGDEEEEELKEPRQSRSQLQHAIEVTRTDQINTRSQLEIASIRIATVRGALKTIKSDTSEEVGTLLDAVRYELESIQKQLHNA